MFERFTERARKVMALANQEAQRFHQNYIGTEHLLSGLMKEGTGVGANVLKNLGLDLRKVRMEIEQLVQPGPASTTKGKLPQTPGAKKVVECAIEEARKLDHNYVGTEHLLLGLLCEREGTAARVLTNLGLTLEHMRDEVLNLLGAGLNFGPDSPTPPGVGEEVVALVDEMIRHAVEIRATDIHIDQGRDGCGQVRMRTDGVLHVVDQVPQELIPKVIDRIKAMVAVDVDERRLPQDGMCSLEVGGCNVGLRVNAVPAHYGERVVVRIATQDPENVLLGLSKLGLSDADLETVRMLSRRSNGIVIANGPTGSGKTTLLYSMLMAVNQPKICIMTVEDPVELAFAGMGQIQIQPQIGFTMARAIQHAMRQDPDVVMVGEIRDLEVARLCAQCALTGHLVLTTLHANTSPGAVKRLLDVGLEPFLVSSALAGVISPRLVRVLCPKCKAPTDPPPHSLPPEAVQFVASHTDAQFFKPVGCEHCGSGRGYQGRTGLFEILVMNDRLRRSVSDGADLAALRTAAREEGMKTMLVDGLEKAARGITSIEEVICTVPHGMDV